MSHCQCHKRHKILTVCVLLTLFDEGAAGNCSGQGAEGHLFDDEHTLGRGHTQEVHHSVLFEALPFAWERPAVAAGLQAAQRLLE